MRAVVFTEPDKFELANVPDPASGADLVIVAIKATTICATDVKILHGTVPFVKFPHIPGHEFGGGIVEVGANVKGLRKGDLVGVEAHVGCGNCPRCLEGLYNLCENYGNREAGHAHIGFTVAGGLAEYCAVPAKAAHLMPEGLNANHAMFTDTLGIVLWAFERAGGVRGGETVAVVGPGALGLLAVQVAHALGAGRVIVVGIPADGKRLELASRLGADDVVIAKSDISPARSVRELTNGKGVDLVIEFAGTADAGRQSLEMARRGGRVVLAGSTSPGRELNVDLSVIVRGHLNVYGSVANPQG
ncbi:MAG: alcohol dehydrogenase catalytic domain-containing protein, partial [Anaerolineales bacterium]|nr:alcohol dehydrogenase catalytic domain-containing protein [Anaerolineales bacterium]